MHRTLLITPSSSQLASLQVKAHNRPRMQRDNQLNDVDSLRRGKRVQFVVHRPKAEATCGGRDDESHCDGPRPLVLLGGIAERSGKLPSVRRRATSSRRGEAQVSTSDGRPRRSRCKACPSCTPSSLFQEACPRSHREGVRQQVAGNCCARWHLEASVTEARRGRGQSCERLSLRHAAILHGLARCAVAPAHL